MINQHKSIPTSMLSLTNDYTMPIKDPQNSQGGAYIKEDNRSLPTTGHRHQSNHYMHSNDCLIPEFAPEQRYHRIARRLLKIAETRKSDASAILLQSLSLSLRNLKLHEVVEEKASSDDDCDDYVDDDGMNDSIHLTKQRFNRHHHDILGEDDLCEEHERDANEISKSGQLEHHCSIINSALPVLKQQTLRATAA